MKKYSKEVVLIFFISIPAFSCSNQYQDNLKYARSLSNDQLITLFNEMEYHWRRIDRTPIDGLSNFPENSRIPEILPNLLGPKSVNPRKGYINLRPSIDEDVRLYFIGLAEKEFPSAYQAIELHYYEGKKPTSEILWEQGERTLQ